MITVQYITELEKIQTDKTNNFKVEPSYLPVLLNTFITNKTFGKRSHEAPKVSGH